MKLDLALPYDINDDLRGSGGNALLITMQFLCWAKASLDEERAFEPNFFDETYALATPQWHEILIKLFKNESFTTENIKSEALPTIEPGQLERIRRRLIDKARDLLNNPLSVVELIYEIQAAVRHDSFWMPLKISNLMIALFENKDDTPIYCPFASSITLALTLLAKGKSVAFEAKETNISDLVVLMSFLTGTSAKVQTSDPITKPSFVDGDVLTLFDISIASLPFVNRRPIADLSDAFDRFPVKSSYVETIGVSHIVAQIKGKALILLPEGFLFRTAGGEKAYKELLVRKGLVRAVLKLPAGTFPPQKNLETNLLFIDQMNAPFDRVVFADLELCLSSMANQNYEQLASEIIKVLVINTLNSIVDCPWACVVNTHEIAENDFNLSVSRYVQSEAYQRVLKTLRDQELVHLQDLVNFIRPQSLRSKEGDSVKEFLEIATGDVDRFGRVQPPTKSMDVRVNEISKAERQVVQDGDVLISIKGKVGVVGYVQNPEENWVPGQSFIIARPRSSAENINPHALVRYFRSGFGQSLLDTLAHGATVPMIQMKDLKKLPVIIPTAEEQSQLDDYYRQTRSLTEKIEKIESQLNALDEETWPDSIKITDETKRDMA